MFRQRMTQGHWTSIETGTTAMGVPDSEVAFPPAQGRGAGTQCWVEFKRIVSGWRVAFRPGQVAWLHRRYRVGGRAFVAARRDTPSTRVRPAGSDTLWLVPASLVMELEAGGLSAVSHGSWHWEGGPSNWNWGEAERVLRNAGNR